MMKGRCSPNILLRSSHTQKNRRTCRLCVNIVTIIDIKGVFFLVNEALGRSLTELENECNEISLNHLSHVHRLISINPSTAAFTYSPFAYIQGPSASFEVMGQRSVFVICITAVENFKQKDYHGDLNEKFASFVVLCFLSAYNKPTRRKYPPPPKKKKKKNCTSYCIFVFVGHLDVPRT